MKNLSIKERRNDSVVILDLHGNIRLGKDIKEFHETIRLLVERGEKNLLINLANITYIDSSGLGELVAGYTTLQKNEGEMKLLHLTDRVSELMVITKLLTVFEVYEDEKEAIDSFRNDSDNNELTKSAYVTGKLDKTALNQ